MHFLFILILIFICSCADSTSSNSVSTEESDIEGFILVHASGSRGSVGTNDSTARAIERPSMGTSFSYDFSLGRHEVTCGEFLKVMKKELGSKSPVQSCDNDNHPVVNVTYYDAILYANALSKSQKRDTVYSYSSADFDGDGHCINLSNMAIDTDVQGFRLPTEAEWSFAARINWDPEKSWNADNSDYRAHSVCKKTSSETEFCDMAGNVMEWVYDWLDYLCDTTITNFIGPLDGNTLGERIVKGGSFRDSPDAMNIFNRGDVYTITSSSRQNYVGFRLAFGKIPDPSGTGNGCVATESTIKSLVNSDFIKSKAKTYNTKMVFRNDITGNLVYINYALAKPKITEFRDTVEVYHPEISPNGQFIAYCTVPEGVSGKSSVFVRPLNSSMSSATFKLNVESAAIPRWQVTSTGDTVIIYVSSAQNNKDDSKFKTNSTWQVSFRNNTFGTPKKIFDGAYHGGLSSDRKLAVTGARILRTKYALGKTRLSNSSKDSIWYNGEQACNVSLANDGSKRTLFLDFASETGKKFVGKSYKTHERLFIADSTGKLIKSIAAPSGKTFDHTEWVSKNLIVATITNNNGAHEKIVLIDLKDSSIVDLVQGDELWHPSIRIAPSASEKSEVDPDSAGVYLFANDAWASTIMRYKMEMLWEHADSANVAFMGSSRTMYALSPNTLSKDFYAVNFGHAPNSIYATQDFLNLYIYKHLKNLKYIVLSIDIDFWWKVDGKSGDNFFDINTPSYPGYVYDANHNYWEDGIPEGLLDATRNGLGIEDSYVYTADRGRILALPCLSWGNPAEVQADSTILDREPKLLENSMNALKAIIKKAANNKIKVVGVIFPQNPKYKKTGAFGRHGMRRSTAKKVINQLKDLTKEYSNFVLLDENKMGDHDYPDNLAHDHDHLCSEGAIKITARVDSVLKTLK